MALEIGAHWYRGLRNVAWSPDGVCVLVGQNGAGKTTLLHIPRLFQSLAEAPLPHALELVGGQWGVVHVEAPEASGACNVRLDGLDFSVISRRNVQSEAISLSGSPAWLRVPNAGVFRIRNITDAPSDEGTTPLTARGWLLDIVADDA